VFLVAGDVFIDNEAPAQSSNILTGVRFVCVCVRVHMSGYACVLSVCVVLCNLKKLYLLVNI
jgi:hypothetical protein